MTKFSSFLVFAFGVLVIAVVIIMFVQRQFGPDPSTTTARRTELPVSTLPPLNLGMQDGFIQQLDKLYESGGLDAVKTYISQEFVPGRRLQIPSSLATESAAEYTLLDREIRRCDAQGVAVMTEPVLPRTVVKLEMGDDATLRTWYRNEVQLPFYITVWWVPMN